MAQTEFDRVIATTIAEHFRDETPVLMRNRKLPAMLDERGRTSYGHEGKSFDWPVEWRETDIEQYGDMDQVQAQRFSRYKRAELDWRGYNATDGWSKKEGLMNKGQAAIVQYTTKISEKLVRDFNTKFHAELYIDGNATGNENRIHGLHSFLGVSGNSGYLMTTNDSYAGLETSLAYYGGDWTADPVWPFGNGDVEYDFWSPLVLNTTSTSWSNSTKTWAANAEEIMAYAITGAERNGGKDGQVDLILLDRQMYLQFKNSVRDKERIIVNQNNDLIRLGFKDVIEFDGTTVTSEFGMPVSDSSTDKRQGYGLNLEQLELMSLQDDLFVVEGPYYDETQKFNRVDVDFFGNMRTTSPSYHFLLRAA